MEYYITTPADYWIAQNAVSITLNALGDKNRIQGSVASGSVIMCFVESIKAENAGGEQGNGEGLWYGSNHEPKRWPLSLSPTYFNSDTHKYVYVAIPRSASVGSQAIIVFPSEQLDIYGRAIRSSDDSSDDSSDGVEDTYIQVGSTNYFYVWLNGIISAPRFNPETNKEERAWEDPIGDREWGLLETAQGREEQFSSGEWYSWSAVNQTVTFLKKIVMSPASWFQNLIIGSGTTQGNLNGVAKQGITTQQNGWDSHIVTPEYLDEFGNTRYLRKDQDDSTPYTLTMGGADVTGDATVGDDLTVNGDTALNGTTTFGTTNFIPDSTGYGYYEDRSGDGGHFLQVENLKVLGKMEAKEVEIQEVNYVGGSIVLTPANGFTCVEVIPVDDNFDETSDPAERRGYKLTYNRKREDGSLVMNTWQVGDLAYCERWDLAAGTTEDYENHRWWRKVIGVSENYEVEPTQNEDGQALDGDFGYIIVSDQINPPEMEMQSNSVPAVGDKVVMLGNVSTNPNDADRKTAIILSASQRYAPYIRMYRNVPTISATSPWYRLPEPFIDLNGYETNIEADSIKIHGSNNTLINVAQSLGKLDNKFEIWQADDDTTPTLNTEPASLWTVAEYAEHVGDFLILTDGRCFEFKVNSGVYSWEPVTDEYLIAYITELRSKATIFYGSDLPTNYKTNDIWMDATYPSSGTPIYEHEILIATKDSTNGQFNIEDWEPTNDYKQTLTSYMDAINLIVAKYGIQTDGRHETWYKNDYADIDGDKVDAETGNPTSLAQLWACLDNVGSIDPSNPETETVRKSHLGDLAYITSSSQTHPDTLWEYTREVTTVNDAEVIVYGWSESYDEITKTILRESKDTQRAVDGKVTTYIYDSSNESMSHGIASDDYSLGDFWVGVNGTFQYRESNIDKYVEYHNETLVCICGYNDVGAGQNILDWKPIGSYLTNATVASVLIDQGFTKEDGVAKMYAEAVLNGIEANDVNYRGETLASASISALVEDDGNGGWKSAVNIDADRVNVTGQTTFLQNLIQGLDLGDLAFSGAKVLYEDLDNDVKNQITTLQSDLQLKATPEQIYTALTTGNTSIVGGVISTQLLDVDTIAALVVETKNLIAANGTFTGRLEAQEGFFKGYLRTAFENADNVEIADRQNHYNLSCEHCNLIVSRNKEYVLPSGSQALQHVGKRMVFVDYVENTNEVQANAYPVQISLSNDAAIGFVGFLGNDVNTNSTNNPKSLLFKNGVLEFVCSETLVNGVRYAYWILISNQTAWCKRSDSIFRGVKMTPMLLWYGTVDISQMPDYNAEPSSSNTIFSASYIADGVGITGIKANRPTGACHIHVDISGASVTSWKKNLMVTVTGFGTYNNSPVMASVISNERPNSGNTANIGIMTYTYIANVESKFLMKIEFIG